MRFLLVIVCISLSFLARAQYGKVQLEAGFSLAFPVNEFAEADEGDQSYFGMGLGVTVPLFKDSPLRLGIDFRYFWMGNRQRAVDVNDTNGFFIYNLDTKISGAMMPLHVKFRIDPMNMVDFPVLPYVGGFAGIRFFNVVTNLEFDYQDGEEPYEERDRTISTTASYGFEVGVHVRVGSRILIDVRYERAFGEWAEYLDPSSVEIDDNGYTTYTKLKTRTDVDMFTLGIVVQID